MNTELTTINDAMPSTGMDLLRDRIANVKICQNTSKMSDKKPGYLYNDVTQDYYKEIVFLPLQVSLSRTFFPPGSAFGSTPVCKSYDGIVPASFIEHPQGKDCASCKQSQWGRKPGGKPQAPACPEEINFLGIAKETMQPMRFKCSGAAFKLAENLIATIRAKSKHPDYKQDYDAIELYDWFFTISSVPVDVYYNPKFSDITRVKTPGTFKETYLKYAFRPREVEEPTETVEKAIETAVEV